MDFKITGINKPNKVKGGEFFRELLHIKTLTIFDLKNMLTEINSLYGFNNRLDTVEKRISDLKDNMQTEA